VDDFYLLYLQIHMDNTFVLMTSIPTEYRSAIFTNSDAQAEIAKRVTEEVQAKHFTPKGKSPFPLFPKLLHRLFCYIPNRDLYPAAEHQFRVPTVDTSSFRTLSFRSPCLPIYLPLRPKDCHRDRPSRPVVER
jgi:hypothetical protein